MNLIFFNRPIRLFRFLLLSLIATCCFLGDYKYHGFEKCKNFFDAPRYYMLRIVNLPFEFSKNLAKYFISYKNLVQENTYLKQLINLQTTKLQVLNSVELENLRLKKLLNFAGAQKNLFSLAHIIEAELDPFKQQIVIDQGFKQGAYLGQPIVTADGVLGSLVKVEKDLSIGILITDLSYAIPVLNLRNGFRAIAVGTGSLCNLNLQHVPKTADIKEADLFVTSGLGGKYPAGYIIGKVSSVKKEVNFPFASISLDVAARLDSYGEVLLIYNQPKSMENT